MSRQPIIYKPLAEGEWPGKLHGDGQRKRALFTKGLDVTERELREELWHHVDGAETAAVIQVAIPPEEWRLDGTPRVRAQRVHPGVVVSFPSIRDGSPLRLATDLYTEWHHNLRAVLMVLEGLRMIERHGVGTGHEQYAGFRAIGSGIAMPAAKMTVDEAAGVLIECSRTTEPPERVIGFDTVIDDLYDRAAKIYHPDRGGSHETMVRINEARAVLKGNQ